MLLSLFTGLLAADTPVVQSNHATLLWFRRDQFELTRAGQPTLVQSRAVPNDPGVEEELVLVDHIQPIQFRRELAAT